VVAEAVWPMAMQAQDGMDGGQGPYPERPGEPDCVYYMRTGLCGFGMTCRFNHPPNRKLVRFLTVHARLVGSKVDRCRSLLLALQGRGSVRRTQPRTAPKPNCVKRIVDCNCLAPPCW
jgi:hypothetical protein